MTSETESLRQLGDQLSANFAGVRAEFTEFASGGAMLDVYCSDGRTFVMAYSPTAGYGVDEVRASDGFEIGYRCVVNDRDSAIRELHQLLSKPANASVVAASLNLVVVYAHDLDAAMRFYECLGLKFQAEQHGAGPRHFAAETGDAILEIYPSAERGQHGGVRLGFQVQSIERIVNDLRTRGTKIVSEPIDSPWGRRAVVEDPDGNRVELTQPIARLVSA